MVRITPELVRKRAEHNDMELSTLEELSLHQMNIEKIEYLQRWCPKLKILLLQGNLISKIENLNRLKELQYLNLALNNIENVTGLESCESLRKLDLTANFITDLQSLITLQGLSNLEEIYLTGNPCTNYEGYRPWVISHLLSLKELDGNEIAHSERLKSKPMLNEVCKSVQRDEEIAFEKRKIQKQMYDVSDFKEIDDSEMEIQRWNEELTENTPEVRIAMSQEMQRRRDRHENQKDGKKEKKEEARYFSSQGDPLNMNKAKVDFTFKDDEENNTFVLEVKTYKYLNGEHLTCDVQPWYVRVMIKGRPLQIVYPSEVKPGLATALRSQVTGHLVITAPKFNCEILEFSKTKKAQQKKSIPEVSSKNNTNYLEIPDELPNRWLLEPNSTTDTPPNKNVLDTSSNRVHSRNEERPESPNLLDNPEVPPLE